VFTFSLAFFSDSGEKKNLMDTVDMIKDQATEFNKHIKAGEDRIRDLDNEVTALKEAKVADEKARLELQKRAEAAEKALAKANKDSAEWLRKLTMVNRHLTSKISDTSPHYFP